MIIEYSLTPDDVVAFTRYQNAKAREQQPATAQGGMIVTVFFVVGFCLLLMGDAIQAEAWQIVLIMSSVFAAIGLLYWSSSRAQQGIPESRLRRMFQSRAGEKALGQRRLILEPNSFTITNQDGEESIPWNRVVNVGVTEEHAFLGIADGSVLIIPSRAFSNDYLYTEFLETIDERKRASDRPRA